MSNPIQENVYRSGLLILGILWILFCLPLNRQALVGILLLLHYKQYLLQSDFTAPFHHVMLFCLWPPDVADTNFTATGEFIGMDYNSS